MTNAHTKGPRPAFVEDYDDDKNTVISSTREFAKTPRTHKDGSDSGYSSKTGTIDGDSHAAKHGMADIRTSSLPIERQRKPYSSGPPAAHVKAGHEQKATRPIAPTRNENNAKAFRHEVGSCFTCDQVGYHMTQKEYDVLRSQIAVEEEEGPTLSSKKPSSKTKHAEPERNTRRMSSHTGTRPAMLYPPSATPAMPALYMMPAPYQAPYATSPGPVMYAPIISPHYSQTPITPSTPYRGSEHQGRDYFEAHDAKVGRPKPNHRNSMYAGNQPSDRGYDSYDYGHPNPFVEPFGSTRRPEPQHASSNHDRDHSSRQERDEYDHRRDHQSNQQARTNKRSGHGPLAVRTRDLSPRRQSAIYEDGHLSARPKPRHSISESYPTQFGTRYTAEEPTSRRATQPTTAIDAKIAVAEAYQEKQGGVPAGASPRKTKQSSSSHAHTRSEASSNHSHRESQYSSSKLSTQSKRARRESIIIETTGKRPMSISMPNGAVLHIGSGSSEKPKAKAKEPKLIEHAPSSTSTVSKTSASRSRAATSSYTESDRGREREHDYKLVRRVSHVIPDSRPPPSPIKVSSKYERSSSRAGSRSRASTDGEHRRR